jgi:SAM-dependent methyltransferase
VSAQKVHNARIQVSESSSYDDYVQAEWALFAADPRRSVSAREVLARMSVGRVLDIGCGAGQELRPFVERPSILGVGLDLSPEAGILGRRLFAGEQPGSRVTFICGSAESLPFASSTFDVVICRLALPYTYNAVALAQISRVLRRGGVLLLKFHHLLYYTLKLREAIAAGRIKAAIHAMRVLLAGALYHLSGRQPRNRILGTETFQTMALLRRELRRHGLEVERMLDDSVPAAPSLLISRRRQS